MYVNRKTGQNSFQIRFRSFPQHRFETVSKPLTYLCHIACVTAAGALTQTRHEQGLLVYQQLRDCLFPLNVS